MRRSPPLPILAALAVVLASCGGGSSGSSSADPPSPSPTATLVATPEPTGTPAAVAAGDLDPTFGAGGIVLLPAAGTATVGRHSLRVLADGGVELIVLDRVTTSTTVRIARLLLPDGARIDDEVVTVATEPTHAAFGNDGNVWVLDGSGPALRLSRFSRNGGVVSENGSSLVALSRVSELVPLPDGGMLAVGTTDRAASGLQRFDASGAADATFGGGPPLPLGLALGPATRGRRRHRLPNRRAR